MPYRCKFPRTRLATIDHGVIAGRRHHVISLLELDVTDARSSIRRHRRTTGSPLSFNAFVIKAVSRALENFPEAHAYRGPGRSLVLFEHIDITVMVERAIDGKQVPLTYVLRNTEKKSAAEITAELEQVRGADGSDSDVVLGQESGFLFNLYFRLPGPLRRLFWRSIRFFPESAERQMGSAVITNVGMMGHTAGWFIPKTQHPLCVGVGAIIKKPAAVKNQILPREILHLTVLLDHDVIDGAPMTRFIQRLSNIIESGI